MANHTNQLNTSMREWMQTHASKPSPSLRNLIKATHSLDNAEMLTSPEQLQLLAFLAKSIEAKNAIEVGVFTGASTLAIAEVLPDSGSLVACDISADYISHCYPAWKDAQVDHKIDLRVAPALDTLQILLDEGRAKTFDFMYIDADKINAYNYYEFGLQLIRCGGIIAIDNMFYGGEVAEDNPQNPNAIATKELAAKLIKDDRINYTLIPIGDGLALAMPK